MADLSARLSDVLLEAENAAFVEHARVFTRRVPDDVIADARKRHDDPVKLARDSTFRARVGDAHDKAVADALGVGRALFGVTSQRSLTSIGEELRLCERTLAPAYAGIAARATAYAESLAPDVIAQAVQLHSKNLAGARKSFDEELGRMMVCSITDQDDVDKVMARVFSPDPVRGLGIAGRGIWHRTPSWLDGSARACSIGVMNSVRELAMARFNVEADAVDAAGNDVP